MLLENWKDKLLSYLTRKKMPQDHFYRFRSTHALLDGHNELEEQYIYFCPPKDLNDPMEGFANIFWQGDEIVWRNLLRHYLLNLMQALAIGSVMGKEFSPDKLDFLPLQSDDDLPEAPIREIYKNICSKFFDHTEPGRLIKAMSALTRKIRREELGFYIRLIHPLALDCVCEGFETQRLKILQSRDGLGQVISGIGTKLNDFISVYAQMPDVSDAIFKAVSGTAMQLDLIHDAMNPVVDEQRAWIYLLRDFPRFYITAIEKLLYPDWHTACFVAEPKNASMWGTYGDGHKGVCLKFKTKPNVQGQSTLDLYRATSWSGGKNEITPNYSYVPHSFHKVSYTAEFPEIDFYESMATMPRFKLEGFWFKGPNGEQSTTAMRMRREDDEWRKEYWEKFGTMLRTKSPQWSHEDEHRLELHSNFQRFDSFESRKLKYKFSDLSGVVFGIKTSHEDKVRIMRVIEKKCALDRREDFEFFQAYFSEQSKKIEFLPLSLIKMKFE